jgi:hypothetical protein
VTPLWTITASLSYNLEINNIIVSGFPIFSPPLLCLYLYYHEPQHSLMLTPERKVVISHMDSFLFMKHQTHNTGNEYKKVNNEVLMCHCSGTDNN